MLLQNQVAIVTGAGRGIGAATAKLFAKEGAKVVVNDLNAEPADEVVDEIKAAGGEGRFSAIKAPTMWMETGTYYGMGEGVPFVAQYASYWPKRWRRQLIESRFAIGVAGEQVTLFEGGDTTGRKLTGPTYEAALHQARIGWAQLLYPLLEDDYTLSVEGRPVVKVLVQNHGAIGPITNGNLGMNFKLILNSSFWLISPART